MLSFTFNMAYADNHTRPIEVCVYQFHPLIFLEEVGTPQRIFIDLIKEIRLIRPDILTIICTGYSSQIDNNKAKSLGINAFMYKPIVKDDIAKMIRKVIDTSENKNNG